MRELWQRCRLVGDDEQAASWIRSRALDVGKVEDFDLVRVLPADGALPSWCAMRGRSWRESGHRIVAGLYDEHGSLVSLHARRLTSKHPKGVSPSGFAMGGLIMADLFSRLVLKDGLPDWWAGQLVVFITEGVPDFLTCASYFADSDEHAPMVLGILSGSWSPAIAKRIPPGAKVIVRTHHDDAGRKYAGQIAKTLRGRCELLRSKP